MIEIDGSFGEGGGAILRQAIALAAYAGQAVRLSRIRANREPPGMKPQHVKAVEAVAAISGAKVAGAAVRSSELGIVLAARNNPVAPGFMAIGRKQ